MTALGDALRQCRPQLTTAASQHPFVRCVTLTVWVPETILPPRQVRLFLGLQTDFPTRRYLNMQKSRDRLAVVRALLVYQLAGCVVLSAVALVIARLFVGDPVDPTVGLTAPGTGFVLAYSVLLGGLICLVPNCYFAYRMFKFQGARAAREIVRSFYAGEAGKLALSALMFAAVFIGVRPLNPLALFAGFCLIQLVGWVVPLVFDRSGERTAT